MGRLLKTAMMFLLVLQAAACGRGLEDAETSPHEPFEPAYDPPEIGKLAAVPDIEVVDGLTYVDGILIANKEYALPEDYNPGLQPEVIESYKQMFRDGAEEGLDFILVSGFRSYDYQVGLYNRYAAREGKEAADRYSARPGHSEHQTGLTIDVGSAESTANLKTEFGETPEYKWMKDVAHEYGFIVRYPEGKEAITGYMYEPWHLRYVGDEAEAIYESGLSLEEYLGID